MAKPIIISSRPLLADNIKDHNPHHLITIIADPSDSSSETWEKHLAACNDFSDCDIEPLFDRCCHLRLNFTDTEDAKDPFGPKPKHIRKIIECERWWNKDSDWSRNKLIVCCNGGISRSSAVAIGILCAWTFDPDEACKIAFDHKPNIWPNSLILSLFDDELKLGGTLVPAARKAKATPRCPDCFNVLLTTLDDHTCP